MIIFNPFHWRQMLLPLAEGAACTIVHAAVRQFVKSNIPNSEHGPCSPSLSSYQ